MGVGHVVQGHVGDAPFAKLGGQRLGGCLGVAVHGGVDNQHALDFRLIAAPFVVLVDEVAQILPPHGTMKGADIPDLVQDAAGLAQQQLDVGAILAHDVGEVPAGLVDPVPVEVHLVGKQLAVQGDEGPEGVGGEEDAVGGIKGHHGLGPVDHGSSHKGDGVVAEGIGVALLDLDALVTVHMEAELAHQHEGLLRGDDPDLGIAQQDLLDGGAVVRLHVVDDQIVQRRSVQQVFEVLQQLAAGGPVHRVKQDALFVQQQIGVVADPLGDGVDVLKQSQTVVIGADPIEIFGNSSHTMHAEILLYSQMTGRYASMNWSLGSAHSGQTQSSGSFSNNVPGAMSPSGSPSSGMYS